MGVLRILLDEVEFSIPQGLPFESFVEDDWWVEIGQNIMVIFLLIAMAIFILVIYIRNRK